MKRTYFACVIPHRCLCLTFVHMKARIQFAGKPLKQQKNMSKKILERQKKNNFYWTDDIHSYWHNLWKEEDIFSLTQKEVLSVITLGYFILRGYFNIAFLEVQENRHAYFDLLERHLLNKGEKLPGPMINRTNDQFTPQKTKEFGCKAIKVPQTIVR